MIRFSKYHGAGNDFILVDDRNNVFPREDVQSLVALLCNRHFGIGSDGLMLLRDAAEADFEMVYFNADGRVSSMCGNGGRCIVAFASSLGMIGNSCEFIAVDGRHRATLIDAHTVSLEMSDVSHIEHLGEKKVFLDTGSPHYVELRKDVQGINMVEEARSVRYSDRFAAAGVNVNFMEMKNGAVHIRTYERGVEDETLACGTGVTAAAMAAHHWGLAASPVTVQAMGGRLEVSFTYRDGVYTDVWKTGPVQHVFEGTYSA